MQLGQLRRRDFITLLGGAAAWPLAAGAQQAGKIWRIAMLDTASPELNSTNMGVFLEKLREYGYVEGKNLTIDYRSAGGRDERLLELVSQLIGLSHRARRDAPRANACTSGGPVKECLSAH